MKEKDPRQIQAELAMPFAPEDLEWRLQKVIEARELGIAVPYVTNRAIMGRLDDVVGRRTGTTSSSPGTAPAEKKPSCAASPSVMERASSPNGTALRIRTSSL